MDDAARLAVAVLAVSLGYFLRTVVPYVNARRTNPSLRFESRYALWGLGIWLVSVWTALTTVDRLPDLFQESLGATFLAYLMFAVAGNHVVFEALDKGRSAESTAREEAWFASCWRCRKDFVYSEPVSPVRQRGGRPRGAMG